MMRDSLTPLQQHTTNPPRSQLKDSAKLRGPHFSFAERASGDSFGRTTRFRPLSSIVRPVAEFAVGLNTIFAWEIQSLLRRPSTWFLLLGAVLTAGAGFSWLLALLARSGSVALRHADDPIVQFLGPNLFLVGLVTLAIPLLTMNFVADERRRGTWELLRTSPVSLEQILIGKFLAAWSLLGACLSPWLLFLVVLRYWNGHTRIVLGIVPWPAGLGVDFDMGPMWGGVFGLGLLGGTFVALGLFSSSINRRPIAAALQTFGIMIGLLLLSLLPRVLVAQGFSLGDLEWLETISCWGQLARFSRGTILPGVVIAHVSVWLGLLWASTWIGRRIDQG